MGSSMLGVKAFPVIGWLVVLLGGFGLPIGVPPLPEDPMMANIAPEQCVAYLSSAGMAAPDAKSGNQTEQLLAEPEIRQMTAEIERIIKASLRQIQSVRPGSLPPGASSDELADAAKLLLTRPLAIYVSSIQMQPGGPTVRGAVAVNCGDDAAKLKATIEALTKAAPPQLVKEIEIGDEKWTRFTTNPDVGLAFGFHGNYFIVTVGEGETDALLKRAAGAPPAWLAKLRKDLPVDRLSTVTYINLDAIKKLALPMAGPPAANVIKALGLDNVTTLASVTGLDQKGCVGKTLFSIDGEPEGILRLADVKPLAPADLAPIPHDATFALAYRLDAANLFGAILDIVGKVEPRVKQEMLRDMGQMEDHLGLKIRDDLLKPLGDTWCIFDSPSEGGVLMGTTLVVSLKDPEKAKETSAKFATFIKNQADMENQPQSNRIGPPGYYRNQRLDVLKFAGHDINIFSPGGYGPPFAPAWCVTEKELIVSLFPQSIKGYLSRPANFQSLAQVPEVAEAFSAGGGPVKLAYGNSRRLFDVLYPMLPSYYSWFAIGLHGPAGVNPSPALLPSARVIRSHLAPTVIAVRRTKAGIEVTEHHTLPGHSLGTAAPVGVGLMFPAIHSARAAARRAQSENNMKQIDLGLLMYENANRTYPPAYKADKNGKPLLSWRVLILPYLEQQILFEQFHLDEPWNSEHNKKLIDKMPAVYRSPTSTVSGQWKTNYLTIRGKNTVFPGEDGVAIASLTDGTSNTIMTVEASDAKAVIWTKPDDFEFDEQNPLKGLVGLQPDGFIAGFADGSVQLLPSSINPQTLKKLFIRNDGEAVNPDEIYRR